MSSIPTKQIDGDVTVGRHVTTGGNATVRGNAKVGHNLRVEGWLDAPNIKGPNKGLYKSVTKLREAYPRPQDGWCALVGDTLPAQLYIAENGAWVAQKNADGTPKLAGEPTVQNQVFEDALDDLTERTTELETNFAQPDGQVPRIGSRLSTLELRFNSFQLTKGMPDGLAPLDGNGLVPYSCLPADVRETATFGGFVTIVDTDKISATSVMRDGTGEDEMVVYDTRRNAFLLAVRTDKSHESQLLIGTGSKWKEIPPQGTTSQAWPELMEDGTPLLTTKYFTFHDNWMTADSYGKFGQGDFCKPYKDRLYVNRGTNVVYRGTGSMIGSTDNWLRNYIETAKRELFDDLWKAAVGVHGSVDHTHTEGGISKPYYLNGLRLTYEEAGEVYNLGWIDSLDCRGRYRRPGLKVRTNIPPHVQTRSNDREGFDISAFISAEIEVLNLNYYLDETTPFIIDMRDKSDIHGGANDMPGYTFDIKGCREIKGVLDMRNFRGDAGTLGGIWSDGALQEVRIANIRKTNYLLFWSPKISAASIRYMIDHAANSGNIVIYLDYQAYAKLSDDKEEHSSYHELEQLATAKNISLATR